MKRALALFALGASLMAAACGESPTKPRPPGPFIQCPGNVQVESQDGHAVAITFSVPDPTGGTAPLNVTCSPASGTALGVGTHTVTCTVADAAGQTASCTFTATVKAPPTLSATRFLSFGDSLTWGVSSQPATVTLLELFRKTAIEPPPPTSYPSQLEGLLRARYRLQTPTVYNEGLGGEKVDGAPTGAPSGLTRLPVALRNHPDAEVLLLMEGTNDLLDGTAGATRAIEGLRRMIEYGRQLNKRVFIATIPPQRAGGIRNRDRVAAAIPGFNDQIRALAMSQGVPVVDVYAALRDKLHLIGIDDLHPTTQGYVVIAEVFADAIRSQLEPTTATTR